METIIVKRPANSGAASTPTEPNPGKPLDVVEQVRKPEEKPADPTDQVTVKAIRSFQGVEGFKNPKSEPFTVSKLRAADLFAGGLVEYVDGK